VSEHYLIYGADSILSIRDGAKTQTRRVVTRTNINANGQGRPPAWLWERMQMERAWVDNGPSPAGNPGPYLKAPWSHMEPPEPDFEMIARLYPIYQVGDIIHVREALRMRRYGEHDTPYPMAAISYAADGAYAWDLDQPATWVWKRPDLSPIFMPRGLVRYHLEITDVRIEHVQEITYGDILAEGTERWYQRRNPGAAGIFDACCARHTFTAAWDAINAKRGYPWTANRWVIALTFRKIRGTA
jgi:hypothetical protein